MTETQPRPLYEHVHDRIDLSLDRLAAHDVLDALNDRSEFLEQLIYDGIDPEREEELGQEKQRIDALVDLISAPLNEVREVVG